MVRFTPSGDALERTEMGESRRQVYQTHSERRCEGYTGIQLTDTVRNGSIIEYK